MTKNIASAIFLVALGFNASAGGNFSGSSVAEANTGGTGPVDTLPPTPPGNFTANMVSAVQIDLSWTASTDNIGVVGYAIKRCRGAGCVDYKTIATVAASATSYSDFGLESGIAYRYKIQAID